MIKKFILALMAVFALTSQAQTLNGSWTVYKVFSGDYTKVVETPSKVLVAFASSIIAYDKTSGDVDSYNSGEKLNSSSGVSNVLYNPAGGYAAVVYNDCTIDLIYDDGSIVNFPQIANYVALSLKAVNSISFDGTDILVATTFGVVRIDTVNRKVVDFKNYKVSITAFAKVGDYYLFCIDSYIYSAPAPDAGILPEFENVVSTTYKMTCKAFVPLTSNKFVAKYNSGGVGLGTFTPATNKIALSTATSAAATSDVTYTSWGVSASNDTQLITYDNSATKTVTTLSGDAASSRVTCYNGLQEAWSVNATGFACFDLSAGTTIKAREGVPEALMVPSVQRMSIGKTSRVYVTTRCQSNVIGTGDQYSSYINRISPDGTIENLYPDITTKSPKNTWGMNDWATKPYAVTNVIESAVDPNTYYYSTWWSGLYKITNGQMAANYNWSNSPLKSVANYANDITSMTFDRDNNLWVTGYFDSGDPDLYCLTYDHLNDAPSTTGWVSFRMPSAEKSKDTEVFVSPTTNRVYFLNRGWKGYLAVLDFNGTPADTSDDRTTYISENFRDLDGNEIDFNYIYCICEDREGKLWFGTTGGILTIAQDDLFSEAPRFNHIKVAETNAYLLDSNATYSIIADNENTKWIATDNGLYHVSADGTVILASYTTASCPIPSNTIYNLAYDVNDGSILIGTSAGLVRHNPDGSTGAANYDNVVVYPSSVTADYTGWITIKGLMDKSAVRIADQNGVTKYFSESEGGTLMWNLADIDGNPVGAGVYSVIVDINSAPVTVAKIVVVK